MFGAVITLFIGVDIAIAAIRSSRAIDVAAAVDTRVVSGSEVTFFGSILDTITAIRCKLTILGTATVFTGIIAFTLVTGFTAILDTVAAARTKLTRFRAAAIRGVIVGRAEVADFIAILNAIAAIWAFHTEFVAAAVMTVVIGCTIIALFLCIRMTIAAVRSFRAVTLASAIDARVVFNTIVADFIVSCLQNAVSAARRSRTTLSAAAIMTSVVGCTIIAILKSRIGMIVAAIRCFFAIRSTSAIGTGIQILAIIADFTMGFIEYTIAAIRSQRTVCIALTCAIAAARVAGSLVTCLINTVDLAITAARPQFARRRTAFVGAVVVGTAFIALLAIFCIDRAITANRCEFAFCCATGIRHRAIVAAFIT